MSDKKIADIVNSVEQRIEEKQIELADHKHAFTMSLSKEQQAIIKAQKDCRKDLAILNAIKQAKDVNNGYLRNNNFFIDAIRNTLPF